MIELGQDDDDDEDVTSGERTVVSQTRSTTRHARRRGTQYEVSLLFLCMLIPLPLIPVKSSAAIPASRFFLLAFSAHCFVEPGAATDAGVGAAAIGGVGATLMGAAGADEGGADTGAESAGDEPPAIATGLLTASFVSLRGSLMFDTAPPGKSYGALGSLYTYDKNI